MAYIASEHWVDGELLSRVGRGRRRGRTLGRLECFPASHRPRTACFLARVTHGGGFRLSLAKGSDHGEEFAYRDLRLRIGNQVDILL